MAKHSTRYTFSTLLGRQIKGRGRGHQPFPKKMKYGWPKVSVGPPLKRLVCWVGYPFLRIEVKFYIKYWFDSRPLKMVMCWVGYPFASVDGHHCSVHAAQAGNTNGLKVLSLPQNGLRSI